jgi:hypothetical protein
MEVESKRDREGEREGGSSTLEVSAVDNQIPDFI